jgi:hypothetical protein
VTDKNPPQKAGSPAKKKKWERPRIKTCHLFESNSLACGKNAPMMDQCLQSPLTS